MVEYVLKIDIDETDLVRKLKSAMKKAGALGLGGGGGMMGGGRTVTMPKAITQAAIFPKEMPPMSMSNMQKLAYVTESTKVKVEGFKEKEEFAFQKSQQKAATRRANALERIEKMQGDWKKRMFSAGTIVKLAGLATGVAGLLQFRKMVVDSSPMLQAMLKILNVGIMFILRPIGDMFGFIMRPLVIPFMQFAVQWYIKSLKMIPVWTKIGQSILAALHLQWGDSANLWHAAFVEWQGITEYERAISDSNKRIEALMLEAKGEESEGGEEITEKEQTGIDELILAEQQINDEFNLHYKQLVAEIMSFVNSGDEWQKGQSELYGHLLDLDKIRNQRLQEEFEATQDMRGDLEKVWAYLTGKAETLPKDEKYQLVGEQHLLGTPEQPDEDKEPAITIDASSLVPPEPEIKQSDSAQFLIDLYGNLTDAWDGLMNWLKTAGILQLSGLQLRSKINVEDEEFYKARTEPEILPGGLKIGDVVPKSEVENLNEIQNPYEKYKIGDVLPQFEPTTQAVGAPQWSDEFLADLAKIADAMIDKPQQTTGKIDLFEEARDTQFVDYVGKMGRLARQEEERNPDKGDPNEIGREGLSILGAANYGKSQEQLTTEEKLLEQERLAIIKMNEMGYTKPTIEDELTEDDYAKSGGFITPENIVAKRERLAELQVLHEDAENQLTEAINNGENGREQAQTLREIMDEERQIVVGINELTGEFADLRQSLQADFRKVIDVLSTGFSSQPTGVVGIGGGGGGGSCPYGGPCRSVGPYCGSFTPPTCLTSSGEVCMNPVHALAGGGVISEEIFGIGKCTGKKYRFGEKGDEAVIPMNEFNTMISNTSKIGIPSYITNPNEYTPSDELTEYQTTMDKYYEDLSRAKESQEVAEQSLEDYGGEFTGTKTHQVGTRTFCCNVAKGFVKVPVYGNTPQYKSWLDEGGQDILDALDLASEQITSSTASLTQTETAAIGISGRHDVDRFEGISGSRMERYTRSLYEAQQAVIEPQAAVDEYGEFEGEKTETYRKPSWRGSLGKGKWYSGGGGIGTRNTAEYAEYLAGLEPLQTQLESVKSILDKQEEKTIPYADIFSSEQMLQVMQGVMGTFESSLMGGGDQVTNEGDKIISTHNTEGNQTTSSHNIEGSQTTNLGGITINVNSSAQNSDQLIVQLGPKILKYLQDNDSRVGIR